MVSTWRKKEEKTSKFVDAEGYNRNERGGELTTWNGSTEKGGEKKRIKTLSTERCENIMTLYINK